MRTKSLERALAKIDDTGDTFASCYHWSIALGGYDYGYKVQYNNYTVIRVNYSLREYEWLNNNYPYLDLTKGEKRAIKKALQCSSFSECEF